ncbi:helix-turn-helix domain-containing protein [Dyadobacter sp. 3J3]|uniref:helix-turn-helix domain-containing protein n=1 Tax=Dyadobacter sp. 3J3 TaxID=2606600 RepID=UPI001359D290|nr:helix-turn-helix transcriptional regulator [Dyadobacter sp. 3J3]
MNQHSNEITKKIIQLKRSNGIKPEQMASVLEISAEQYKKRERGTGEITLSHIFRIAEIFNIQAGSLFDEGERVAHITAFKRPSILIRKLKMDKPLPINRLRCLFQLLYQFLVKRYM